MREELKSKGNYKSRSQGDSAACLRDKAAQKSMFKFQFTFDFDLILAFL